MHGVINDQYLTLKPLAGDPVYEIRAEIGTFLVSAETGERIEVDEPLARRIAAAAWAGITNVTSSPPSGASDISKRCASP